MTSNNVDFILAFAISVSDRIVQLRSLSGLDPVQNPELDKNPERIKSRNGQNLDKQNPELDKIPNGQNPKLDKIQNEQNPELDKIPNRQNPESDKIPNGKNPELNQRKYKQIQDQKILTAGSYVNINNLPTKLHVVYSLVSWRPRKIAQIQK